MPYRFGYRRFRRRGYSMRRRPFYRRKRFARRPKLMNRQDTRNLQGVVIRRAPGVPFPTNYYAKLKYVDEYDITNLASDTLLNTGYWATDMNFPSGSATAGLPRPTYFDEFASVYDQYEVLASKIRVQVVPTTATQHYDIVIYPAQSGSTLPTTLEHAATLPLSKWLTISSSGRQPSIGYYLKSKRMCPRIMDNEGGASESVRSRIRSFGDTDLINPSVESPHFRHVIGIHQPTTTASYRVIVQITYYCRFMVKEIVGPSVTPA